MNFANYRDSEKSGRSNLILYIGLGMVCLGLVVTFVGLGEKGFQTLELQLVGPSLIGCGFVFAILQIIYCTLPSFLRSCCDQNEDSDKLLAEEDLCQREFNGPGFGRNFFRNRSRNFFNMHKKPDVPVNTLRPILKNSRKTCQNGGTDLSLAQLRKESVSFNCKHSPTKSQSGGKDDSGLILNSRELFKNSV